MPLRTAARLCPEAVFLPVDREVYEEASGRVMATLRGFGAVVEVLGWDEAFLGIESDDPEAIAERIRRRVREATGLSCSVGIGRNKLQAKLATGFGKPDGVFRLTGETWFAVLGDRPPDALWGVGAKTARRLAGLGITTVGALAAADPAVLAAAFGPAIGPWLIRLAGGRDDSPVTDAPHTPRSRGRETTYQRDLDDWAEVRREVVRLAGQVAADLAVERRPAVRVVVKVRYIPFTTRTHGHTLASSSLDAPTIERAALAALGRFTERRPVRLLGVRAELSDA
jgi:DNA polymerase-4